MSFKTENLAIVMTDIVGYTEATQSQSRRDNARLLATHNHILFPIVRRYKGRHVKSIGDALLLVFRSPTDAMLCSMALQDALFEYNRNTPKEQQIHIRVAASLGEVRVTRNDVFGEAVNITSRIESITPADEIYLSEAVYMAMNKAEVPAQEVGWRELKGVSGPIRVFNIPRFSTPRLVPQDVMAAEDMSDLVYPYGGAHLSEPGAEGGWRNRLDGFTPRRGARAALLAALVLVPATLLAMHYGRGYLSARRAVPPAVAAAAPGTAATDKPAEPAIPDKRMYQPEFTASDTRPPVSAPPPRAALAPPPAPPPRRYQEEFTLSKSEPAVPPGAAYTRISDAKRAYKDDKLSKSEYRHIVNRLEDTMEREIDLAKRDYKAERISRDQLKQRIIEIKRRYE
jgi:class 3 adenylate cyclase